MSKNYIVFDSMMVPPQKNIFLLLYCIIFDNKFLLILRNSKLLSINFLCVTLSHMSIGAPLIFAMSAYKWNQVGAILAGLIVLILIVEVISTKIRVKLTRG